MKTIKTIKEIDFGLPMNGDKVAAEIIDEILRENYKKYGLSYSLAFYGDQYKAFIVNITMTEVRIKYNIRSDVSENFKHEEMSFIGSEI